MKTKQSHANIPDVLEELKHYLPAQAPLKDFIHHNTLHAFQSEPFFSAIEKASTLFGYKTLMSLAEYRSRFAEGKIDEDIVDQVIKTHKDSSEFETWKQRLISEDVDQTVEERVGKLRREWVRNAGIDLDSLVHPMLFRIICSYLDQGVSMWRFPEKNLSFMEALKTMESESVSSFFTTKYVRDKFLNGEYSIESLLLRLVGDENLNAQYLFDQQFAHQGWSGIVASVESQPESLLDGRRITLKEFIEIELLLELDVLVMKKGPHFMPLSTNLLPEIVPVFDPIKPTMIHSVLSLWQMAFEESYYREVLSGLAQNAKRNQSLDEKHFQAVFCIDDRECSIRRHLELLDSSCETFGTPGFFGVAFYYQPEGGKFKTKLCPAPVTPTHLIKAVGASSKRKTDAHFNPLTHSLIPGFLITQSLGFWSALKLFVQIFKPSMSPATSTSLQHMHKESKLSVEHKGEFIDGLQVGFTKVEMTDRVEAQLKSIGLVNHFAPLVYMVSHGSSSVNNPHFSAYDCGACSGRPGSVNARVICEMANDVEVRANLRERGITIPDSTRFVGALHDTSRDEIVFYDEEGLSNEQKNQHSGVVNIFQTALKNNAFERARRFVLLDQNKPIEKVYEEVTKRSVSLFEPRPELNHATNSLCIVGSRNLTKGLFLDRRAFLNSYDPSIDENGDLLFGILKAAAPVCGGINLEYYFSRVDNQKLGAGSKLPHNVMGLVGVANGIDGDLRPGLPSQMVEVHDPVRLMIIVEQTPEKILSVIKRSLETYEWFQNQWIHLVSIHPQTREITRFAKGQFTPQAIEPTALLHTNNMAAAFAETSDNLPVMLIDL
ncbi:MAG: hypothetical protein RLZZ504_1056 [Bacteroidota bacterium]|jgi:uncharacterized protein YbcC (UPF0753/DUF2309 family)